MTSRFTAATVAAALAALIVPAAANASTRVGVDCSGVIVHYTQWLDGRPDASHLTIQVDGVAVRDEVVSFPGATFDYFVPLSLADGQPHTVTVRHDWVNHDRGTKTITHGPFVCAAPPPPAVTTPAPAVTPRAPAATPPAKSGKPSKAKKRQRKADRLRERRSSNRRCKRTDVRCRTTSNRRPRTTG